MKPIGLTLKNIKENYFTGKTSGEPMIVHLCLNCNKITRNRIAGDDNPYTVISLFNGQEKLNAEIKNRLTNLNIRLLPQKKRQEILIALYGNNCRELL